MANSENVDELRALVQSHPLIDNHAHNILSAEHALNYNKYPLESITSEAHGEALKQARHTIPHHIAVKQLATLFACEPIWEAIKAARDQWVKNDYEGFVRKCLEGTDTLLLDDLLADGDIEPYQWHDRFTTSKTKRIVRIETVAAQILEDLWNEEVDEDMLKTFMFRFVARIHDFLRDDDVVGFKSVICYRTGLDISLPPTDKVAFGFVIQDQTHMDMVEESILRTYRKGVPYRISDKSFNDYIVFLTLSIIQKETKPKPIQFHTGLGDSDLDLRLANPAHLQSVISRYPGVDFVLLHSSYPYTREAGYLASVYPNVYLDLGEVFPMVSSDAEETILRQAFDLTPISRLLWSTDGHFHPETFWLSNLQFRKTLETVFSFQFPEIASWH
jgi:hypothetical protein